MADVSFGHRWFSCLNDEPSYTNYKPGQTLIVVATVWQTHYLINIDESKEGFPFSNW